MFTIRWRWNATRSLPASASWRRKLPAPLQRMDQRTFWPRFSDQFACLGDTAGDREMPDHPLVKQTIDDCLTEAMDIDGLEAVLRKMNTARFVVLRVICRNHRLWPLRFLTRGRMRFWITRLWKNAAPRRCTRVVRPSATAAKAWGFSMRRRLKKFKRKRGRKQQMRMNCTTH